MRTNRDGTFSSTRLGLTTKSRMTVGVLVVVCVVLSILWFVFVSRFWSVQKLEISGNKEIGRGEVEQSVYDILDHGPNRPWDQRNIFFVDRDRLADDIKAKLFLESVTVDKVYPNVLRLLVEERQRRVVYGYKDTLLDVDPHGFITGVEPEATSGYFRDLLSAKTLADTHHAPFVVQTDLEYASSTLFATNTNAIVDAGVVQGWLDASKALLGAGLRYRHFKLEQPASDTLKIVSEGGYDIIMDLRSPIAIQMETYKKFMQTKPKDVEIKEYIDVRAAGKIFLK